MNQAFVDYFRCPSEFADFRFPGTKSIEGVPGFFRFGSSVTCYGHATVSTESEVTPNVPDVLDAVRTSGSTCYLPFDPTEVASNLRYERYVSEAHGNGGKGAVRSLYYMLRPVLPVFLRRHLQKFWLQRRDTRVFPQWPVDRSVDRMFEQLTRCVLKTGTYERMPFVWFWPEGKSSCFIMTHDVETGKGLAALPRLMDLNDSFEIKSSFQIIPEDRYTTTESQISEIKSRGFEVNVHDLKHDGRLFEDRQSFRRSAERINKYAVRFGSRGFRSGVLYRNLNWYEDLCFSYDMSVPNVGHLDPQPGGCCTVMPYFIGKILELPLTTTQDYSLFNILGTHSLEHWKTQIEHISQQHGLMSFNVHPDYLDNARAVEAYTALLRHVAGFRKEADVWTALPGEVDIWWRQRANMRLVPSGAEWRIEGTGSERARMAYAVLKDDSVSYVVS